MAKEMSMAISKKKPLVFCGPSGCGKSTLINKLFQKHPNKFALSISHTTRQPRTNEVQGREYHFVRLEDFDNEGPFVERAIFSGNHYGTSVKAIKDVESSGKVCILDIDLQGVKSLKSLGLPSTFIYIRPPSIEALRARLTARASETTQSLEQRLQSAEKDMAEIECNPNLFDKVVLNDDVDVAFRALDDFVSKTLLL